MEHWHQQHNASMVGPEQDICFGTKLPWLSRSCLGAVIHWDLDTEALSLGLALWLTIPHNIRPLFRIQSTVPSEQSEYIGYSWEFKSHSRIWCQCSVCFWERLVNMSIRYRILDCRLIEQPQLPTQAMKWGWITRGLISEGRQWI